MLGTKVGVLPSAWMMFWSSLARALPGWYELDSLARRSEIACANDLLFRGRKSPFQGKAEMPNGNFVMSGEAKHVTGLSVAAALRARSQELRCT